MSVKYIPSTPLKFIFLFTKPYLRSFLIFLFIAFLWAAHTSLDPYLIKLMVDSLESGYQTGKNLLNSMQIPVFIYIFMRVSMSFMDRVFDYYTLKTLPTINKSMVTYLTKYIQNTLILIFKITLAGVLSVKFLLLLIPQRIF